MQGGYLAPPEGSTVSDSEHRFVLQVLCTEDQLHDIRFGRNFRKGMIYLAQGKVVIHERPFKNEAEIFLECAVIDVHRTGSIAQTALLPGTLQMKEKGTELRDVCIIKGDPICILQPGAAFEDRLEITVDRTRVVIDQFQDIRDALEFGLKELRLYVLHVHSFQNRVNGCNRETVLKEEHGNT